MLKSTKKKNLNMKNIYKNRREIENYVDSNSFIRTLMQSLLLDYNYKMAELDVNISQEELVNFSLVTQKYYTTLLGVLIKIKESVNVYKGIVLNYEERVIFSNRKVPEEEQIIN